MGRRGYADRRFRPRFSWTTCVQRKEKILRAFATVRDDWRRARGRDRPYDWKAKEAQTRVVRRGRRIARIGIENTVPAPVAAITRNRLVEPMRERGNVAAGCTFSGPRINESGDPRHFRLGRPSKSGVRGRASGQAGKRSIRVKRRSFDIPRFDRLVRHSKTKTHPGLDTADISVPPTGEVASG